jgi:hypothetical protein
VGVRYPERVLHLDSWYSETGEIIPGITPYGPWRDQGSGATGPWDIRWPYKTLFPEGIDNWPGHERWFNNYTTPVNAEFTIHQNTVLSAAVYGYLCDVPDGSFNPNKKPSVEVISPAQGEQISGSLKIEVTADDPNGQEDIAWVEFYNGWHKIGQTNEVPFAFTWEKPVYGNVVLSAKITDKSGFSTSSDSVWFEVKPMNYNTKIVVSDSLTKMPVPNSSVNINGREVFTNEDGEALFEDISGLMDIEILHQNYFSKSFEQLSVYSDTTLYFSLVQREREVTFVVMDQLMGTLLESVTVEFNGEKKITGENGEVGFTANSGTYPYSLMKNAFGEESGILEIESDTTLYFSMVRTTAEIKFVLRKGTTPVNKAFVVLDSDTLETTSLGIARFKDLPVPQTLDYTITKEDFNDVAGQVFLQTDTVINIEMTLYPVGNNDVLSGSELKIWPNPVSADLLVKSTNPVEDIFVYSITGSKLKLQSTQKDDLHQIDFSGLNTGIYLLEIVFKNRTSILRKIIRN